MRKAGIYLQKHLESPSATHHVHVLEQKAAPTDSAVSCLPHSKHVVNHTKAFRLRSPPAACHFGRGDRNRWRGQQGGDHDVTTKCLLNVMRRKFLCRWLA